MMQYQYSTHTFGGNFPFVCLIYRRLAPFGLTQSVPLNIFEIIEIVVSNCYRNSMSRITSTDLSLLPDRLMEANTI